MAKRGGPGSIQRLLKAESEANANIATARQSMYLLIIMDILNNSTKFCDQQIRLYS